MGNNGIGENMLCFGVEFVERISLLQLVHHPQFTFYGNASFGQVVYIGAQQFYCNVKGGCVIVV